MRRAPSLPNETSGTVWVELCTVHPWPMGALNYALSRPGRCIQTPKYSYPRCTRGDCSYRPVFIFLSSLYLFPLSFSPLSPLFIFLRFAGRFQAFRIGLARPPNRPPFPLVNARFSSARNEKNDREVKQSITESGKIVERALIIFLPACVNCRLRNVQSRENKYGAEGMLDQHNWGKPDDYYKLSNLAFVLRGTVI